MGSNENRQAANPGGFRNILYGDSNISTGFREEPHTA
jgi:hypothetical protein